MDASTSQCGRVEKSYLGKLEQFLRLAYQEKVPVSVSPSFVVSETYSAAANPTASAKCHTMTEIWILMCS